MPVSAEVLAGRHNERAPGVLQGPGRWTACRPGREFPVRWGVWWKPQSNCPRRFRSQRADPSGVRVDGSFGGSGGVRGTIREDSGRWTV